MRFLTTSLFLFVQITMFSQNSFYTLYSGNGFDKGEGIVQLEDSSYAITGSSSSWIENTQAFLLRIDKTGKYLSSNHYGGSESEEGKRILYNKDLGFFIAGFSNSFGNGDFDAYLTRIDLQGNQLWEKTFGNENWERINDATFTKDSSIIMIGESKSTDGAGSDILMMQTDRNGQLIWSKTFGGSGDDRANSIIRVQDSLFIVACDYFVADSNATKGYVFRMKTNGDILWSNIIGNQPGNYNILDLAAKDDRFYAVGTRFTNENNHDQYAGSFDFNGDLLFQYTITDNPLIYDNTINDQATYVTQGDKVAIANRTITSGTFQDDFDVTVGFYDSNFQYWMGQSTTIMNAQLDKTNDMINTLDGGFAAVGFNSSVVNNGGSNIFVLKVDGKGNYPNTQNVYSLNQLVEIQEQQLNSNFSISPNPFQNKVKIHLNENSKVQLKIYNLIGSQIEEIDVPNDEIIDLTHLNNGSYILKINNETLKLMKIN